MIHEENSKGIYLICIIGGNLNLDFSHNIQSFQKYFQILLSVHPLISKNPRTNSDLKYYFNQSTNCCKGWESPKALLAIGKI